MVHSTTNPQIQVKPLFLHPVFLHFTHLSSSHSLVFWIPSSILLLFTPPTPHFLSSYSLPSISASPFTADWQTTSNDTVLCHYQRLQSSFIIQISSPCIQQNPSVHVCICPICERNLCGWKCVNISHNIEQEWKLFKAISTDPFVLLL